MSPQKITPFPWFNDQAEGKLSGSPDRARVQRVMQAMLKMDKIDIEQLQAA
jgi:predicted 3-demethylubiquinone-9 3-methyltransferase (glyoxalase superfamily)